MFMNIYYIVSLKDQMENNLAFKQILQKLAVRSKSLNTKCAIAVQLKKNKYKEYIESSIVSGKNKGTQV